MSTTHGATQGLATMALLGPLQRSQGSPLGASRQCQSSPYFSGVTLSSPQKRGLFLTLCCTLFQDKGGTDVVPVSHDIPYENGFAALPADTILTGVSQAREQIP